MSGPLISVVVPTLNQARFIEQTLLSIGGQRCTRLELIVVDGGSTDGTAAVVERYRDIVTRFVSEPDRGQADAINKGMRLAKGDILAWINSDDYYLPGAFQVAARMLGDTTEPRLTYGACLLAWEKTGRARVALTQQPFDREALTTLDFIYQPSAFWTRSLWEKTGELNAELHFVMDWDWWLRASQQGEFLPTPEILSYYRFHDAHKTSSGGQRRAQEILDLVERHGSPESIAAYRSVAARLKSLAGSWTRCQGRPYYFLHRLRHLALYRRFGPMVDTAFSQLHV